VGSHHDESQAYSVRPWCRYALATARNIPRAKRSKKAGSQLMARWKYGEWCVW